MKNQNDLIVAGAVILVCIAVSLAFFFQKREPVAPPAPASVTITDAQPIPANVQYANSLPGGGGGAQASSGAPGTVSGPGASPGVVSGPGGGGGEGTAMAGP